MVPALRSRAAQAEKDRVMPPETIAELHASGILRSMQPKRWGGMEFVSSPRRFLLRVGARCPSTAWNFGNLQVHHGCSRCTRSARRRKCGARIPKR